jgi:predicted O-methyltransferase YrrM
MDKELEARIISEIPSDDSTSLEEKHILYNEIVESKAKVIVEIGTHKGLTTCYLGAAAKVTGGHVYTYDPNDEWCQRPNINKFPELPISVFIQKGTDCQVEDIDFLFCDGFHEKVYVLEEIDHFLPRLKDGAIIYFHDTAGSNISCDVPGAINERGLTVKYLGTQNGMAKYVHKKK